MEIPWLFPYYVCFRIPTAQLAIKYKRQCDIVCTMVSQQTQRVLRVGFTIESTCLVSFTQQSFYGNCMRQSDRSVI